jgi:hypothetical protein
MMDDTEEAVTTKAHLAQEVDTADLRTKFLLAKERWWQIKHCFQQETTTFKLVEVKRNPKSKSVPAANNSKKTSSSRKSAGATA